MEPLTEAVEFLIFYIVPGMLLLLLATEGMRFAAARLSGLALAGAVWAWLAAIGGVFAAFVPFASNLPV